MTDIKEPTISVYQIQQASGPDRCYGEGDTYPDLHPKWTKTASPFDLNRPVNEGLRDCFPSTVIVDSEEYKIKDWVGTTTGYCVSEKTKELIEQVEPEIHQFMDVELHYERKIYPYFLIKVGTVKDCYIIEKSDVKWRELKLEGKNINYWTKKHSSPLVFNKECVKDSHIWQNKSGHWMICITDKLHELFLNNKITGIKFEKQIVVSSS